MSQILWILPTFIGKIPDPDERQDSENLIPDSLDHLDAAEDRLEINCTGSFIIQIIHVAKYHGRHFISFYMN